MRSLFSTRTSKFVIALMFVLSLWAQPVVAAPAYDAFSTSTTAVSPSWTHTPVGTPRGAIVWVIQLTSTDDLTTCTYGGVSMTELTGSPLLKATGTVTGLHGFFLGSSLPTGAQTVSCSGTGGNKVGLAVTITASANTEIVDVDATVNADSVTDPSITLSLGGRSSFVALSFNSGVDAVGSATPPAGWTSRHETDLGTQIYGTYTYDTIGTSDVTAGWTQSANDAQSIMVAVAEVSAGTTQPKGMLLGVGGHGKN